MSTIKLVAEKRTDIGKGASRRLRRLESKVPAVLYGGSKPVDLLHLMHNKVIKALETEAIYSSVFDLQIGSKTEHVILKDIQRHPYKPIILHMDFQRVMLKDILVKMVPIHFIHEDQCIGVKAGGMINHVMNQIEIRCEARYLPQFIEVDVAHLDLDQSIHLSNLVLPAHVSLGIDLSLPDHDHIVVAVHSSKLALEDDTESLGEESPEVPAAHGGSESNSDEKH